VSVYAFQRAPSKFTLFAAGLRTLLHGILLESILKFDVEGDTTVNFSGRMNSADVVLLQI